MNWRCGALHPSVWSVAALLLPGYATVGLFLYWAAVDVAPPVQVSYVHPKFLKAWASSTTEAAEHQIDTARVNDVVFTYEEYCVTGTDVGTIYRRWVNSQVTHLPEQRTLAAVGCYKRSFRVTAPAHAGAFSYRKEIIYRNNPLRESTVRYPTIDLVVIE